MKLNLDGIIDTLEAVQESRNALLTQSRRAISACGRAIILTHRGMHEEAVEALKIADTQIRTMQNAALPSTMHYIIPAEQEYAEASVFMNIVRHDSIPDISALAIQPESYVLGMLDVIGELKRLMLDQIRMGMADAAHHTFDTMERLYTDLYEFAAYDKVLRESRRKLDVARILLEDCRSIITEEQRRQDMLQSMRAMGFEPTNSSETSPSS